MKKIELLSRINKLSAIVHSQDVAEFNLDEQHMQAMRHALDALTEEYIHQYC